MSISCIYIHKPVLAQVIFMDVIKRMAPVGAKINHPCAACRMLRRRCGDNCLLAPYFPTQEADNFAGVHKVFGASNVVKMLQTVKETEREDTVKSMVYEASARLRDPVYGSAGAIFHLQKLVKELESELDLIRARVLESQEQQNQLLRILMDAHHLPPISPFEDIMFDCENLI